MKNIILIVSICAGFISPAFAQDYIIAGQTSGPNIHYTDYEPDSSGLYSYYYLDIDNNGSSDLLFHGGSNINLPWWVYIWSEVRNPSDNIEIISYIDESEYCVKEIQEGDTISDFQNWEYSDSTLYFKFYGENDMFPFYLYVGEFVDGYLGFKITYPLETFYGWIKITVSNTTITAMESAIYGLTVGVKDVEAANLMFSVYPNPYRNELNVELNSLNNSDKIFDITDVYGNRIKSGKMPRNKTEINTSDMIPGIYFLRVIEGDKIISSIKVIKQSE